MKTEYFERIDQANRESYESYKTSCDCLTPEHDIWIYFHKDKPIEMCFELTYKEEHGLSFWQKLKQRVKDAYFILSGQPYRAIMWFDFIFKNDIHAEEFAHLLLEQVKRHKG